MKLYELTEQYEELLEMLRDGEIDEDIIADTLEGLDGEIDEKVDHVCAMIKTLLSEGDAMKVESDRLAERAKKRQKRADRLCSYLTDMLQRLGRTSFENARHAVKFNRGERLIFTDEGAAIEYLKEHYPELVTTKVEVKPDKAGIKKIIKGGYGDTVYRHGIFDKYKREIRKKIWNSEILQRMILKSAYSR